MTSRQTISSNSKKNSLTASSPYSYAQLNTKEVHQPTILDVTISKTGLEMYTVLEKFVNLNYVKKTALRSLTTALRSLKTALRTLKTALRTLKLR